MKTVQVNVYNYNELSDIAQQKAKSANYEAELDLEFDSFSSCATEKLLADYGIEAGVYYSLCYQQGDGLHFVTENILTEEIVRKLVEDYIEIGHKERAKELGKALLDLKIEIKTRHSTRHYEYASATDVEVPDAEEVIDTLKSELPEQFGSLPEKFLETDYNYFMNKLSILYLDICKTLETEGYMCYDNADKAAEEDVAEHLYYEDGSLYE